MQNKYLYSLCMLLLIGVIVVGATLILKNEESTQKEETSLTVVTSFYPMYVITDNLTDGISGIRLQNLSEPETGCLHDFTLTPEDMKLLSKADVLVINGSGAENFLDDVLKAYPKLSCVNATEEMEGLSEEVGMHAWLSPKLYVKEVKKIAAGLKALCPQDAEKIAANEKAYLQAVKEIRELSKAVKQELLQKDISEVILFSEAYSGLTEELSLKTVYLLDLDEERQVSSGEVAEVMEAVNTHPGSFLIAEDPYGKDTAETVKRQTGIPVLYLDTLTRGSYEKDRYLVGMKKNLEAIREVIHEIN